MAFGNDDDDDGGEVEDDGHRHDDDDGHDGEGETTTGRRDGGEIQASTGGGQVRLGLGQGPPVEIFWSTCMLVVEFITHPCVGRGMMSFVGIGGLRGCGREGGGGNGSGAGKRGKKKEKAEEEDDDDD